MMWRRTTNPTTAIGFAAKLCSGVVRDRTASAVVYTALVLPIPLGAVGLAADVGAWYVAKRTAQSAADAAAMAATFEVVRESSKEVIEKAAEADALLNGYDPAAGDKLEVNNPPKSGPQAGLTTAVEAVVQRTPATFFSQFLFGGPVTVTARAVATVVRPESCVWLLEPSATALDIPGSANVQLDCGVYAQSTSPEAIDVSGSGCLTATSVVVSGGYAGTCIRPRPRVGVPQLGDPLAHLEPPSLGGCDYNNKVVISGGQTVVLPANRVYCGGILVTGGATAVFASGVHVLAGGTFTVQGGGTVRGDGVTFYLTQRNGGGYATLTANAAAMDLAAPTSGALAGVLFFQDRAAPTTTSNSIAGNADLKLQGTLYFPTAVLDYAGGSATNSVSTIIVARRLNFVGGTHLDADESISLYPSGLVPVALTE